MDGVALWGRLEKDLIVLDDGGEIPESDARYLAPVEPGKIIGVHLAYRSRIEEYAARVPDRTVLLHEASDIADRAPRTDTERRGGRGS